MIWIIRVNTRNGHITRQEASPEEMHWGGRLLIAKFLLREVSPACDPLGRSNKLIITPGPLTCGVKESDVGGEVGRKIASLGIKAIVLEDTPLDTPTKILMIKGDHIELSELSELKEKPVTETFQIIRERFGPKVGILCIGPAGEMKMAGAGVAVTDDKDIQVRYAARGGLGAVMGSKGIKAIIVDAAGAPPARAFDEKLLRQTNKTLVQMIAADPKTENRHTYGTPAILMMANEFGMLPTRNFSAGQFEKAGEIGGERIADVIEGRLAGNGLRM
jgi:aldehyde:ferredoxin oxidoreductase